MKRIVASITAVLLCLPAWAGWAGTWKDDFNDRNLDGWRKVFWGSFVRLYSSQRAQWSIVQGMVKGKIPRREFGPGSISPAYALLLSPVAIQGEEFEVEHTVNNTGMGGTTAGTVVTDTDGVRKYVFILTKLGYLSVGKLEHGQRYSFISIGGDFVPNKSTQGRIRVKFKKPRFEVYISGNKIFEFEDLDFQPENVGFYLQTFERDYKAEGFFDDFILSGPAIPDIPVAVKPKSKFTDDLIKQLKAQDFMIRSEAANALGRIGDPKAVEPLIEALKDQHPTVRLYAAIALGQIGDPKAVEPLIEALKDQFPPFRSNVAIALAEIGNKRGLDKAITAMTNDLKEQFAEIHRNAARALLQIGDKRGIDEAVEVIINDLKAPGLFVRVNTAIVLGEIGDKRAIPELERVAKEDEDNSVRDAAQNALEEITSKLEVPRAVNQFGKKATTLAAIKRTALRQNFPNPFNPETWIPYELAEAAEVKIQIYDSTGKLIRSFDLGLKPAGSYTNKQKAVYWNGRNESGELVASGVYFVVLKTRGYQAYQQARRMVLLK